MVSLSGSDPPLGRLRGCKEQLPARLGGFAARVREGLPVVGLTADAPTRVQYRYPGLVEHRVTQDELKAWRKLLIGWGHVACEGRDHYRARVVWRASKAGTGSVARSTRQMGDKTIFWRCDFAAASNI